MPIVSISRIQHRYGLSDNLPQLSAAELGWVIDQRKLYIGNGPTSEGAPEVGNTEVLTQYSDLLGLTSSYTYKGEAAGYVAQTGANANSPVTRSLQSKFDDQASVKDFGAVGDGVTDDTDAINRAFYEIFCRDNNPETRRSLFFPAGLYIVSGEIAIPTYAYLKGEGLDSTIIRQTDSGSACVARTADSAQQTDANIGNNGATLPSFIDIVDITFEQTTSNDVFIINSTTDTRFSRVGFRGDETGASVVGDGTSCLTIYSTAVNHSGHIGFEKCVFSNNVFGVIVDDDVTSVVFNGCSFDDLYKGIKLGENTSGAGASVLGPISFNFTNSTFDNIYSIGLHCYSVSSITSAFNYYADVGNHLVGTPFEACIVFEDDGNASVFDTFERSAVDAETAPYIDMSGKSIVSLRGDRGLELGARQFKAALQATLDDNQSSATSSGITFDADLQKAVRIHYTAERNTYIRHGMITLTASSLGVTLSDDYQEDGGDIGLTLSADVSGSTTTLKYVTTNTGFDVTFTYGVELINY